MQHRFKIIGSTAYGALGYRTSVGKHTNTIVLNGKHYDTITGKIIHPSVSSVQHSANKVVDGFMRAPSAVRAHKAAPRNSHTLVHHKTQRSQTLMRHAVKRPKTSAVSSMTAAQEIAMAWPAPIMHDRVNRAKKIAKSKLVSRFGVSMSETITTRVDVLPVQPAPPPHAKPTTTHAVTSAKEEPNIFSKALQKADNHKITLPKRPKARHQVARKLGVSTKAVVITGVTILSLLAGGYLAYQKVPQVAMRVAAARAGFNATLPDYSPAGFSLKGPIQYSPGQVALSFQSNSDGRNFKITEKASNWTSDTLLDSFVTTNRRPYQTYQDKGKTIYIYEGTNATWVSGGVWYNIEGSSELTSDQLLKIASGL